MTKKDYPVRWSDVEVVYTDGTIETFRISAGSGIGQYLANSASENGILTLFNGRESTGIPLSQIRRYTITELDGEPT